MTACVQRKDAGGTVRFLWQLAPLQRDIIKIVAFLAMGRRPHCHSISCGDSPA